MDDPLMADFNVERRASDFADACQVWEKCTKKKGRGEGYHRCLIH